MIPFMLNSIFHGGVGYAKTSPRGTGTAGANPVLPDFVRALFLKDMNVDHRELNTVLQ